MHGHMHCTWSCWGNKDAGLLVHSHVVNVTGVGHLLHIDTCCLLSPRQHSDDRLLYHILQVGEAPPDIAHILKGVSPGTRVPVPETE